MQFLKTFGAALAAALAIVLAVFKASAATKAKRKAEDALIEAKDLEVAGHVEKAAEAFQRAHDAEDKATKARLQIREKLDRIGEKDETIADTLARWKQSNRMRNRQ